MARIFTEGFEFKDTLFWDAGSSVTINTSTVRSGNAACNIPAAVKTIPALSEFYLRFGWNSNAFASQPILVWRNASTVLGRLFFNNAAGQQHFELQVGTTTVVAGTLTATTLTWYLVELHVKIADSGGVLELKVDGIADASFTGDTKPGTATTVDNLQWLRLNQTDVIDDLALNDTTGGADNSWCGDGHIILLTPNADGDKSEWTGSDGNQVNNYALADEIPANGDTDYVESSTLDQTDLYNLTASGLSGVTIKRVWAEARARDTVAAGGLLALVLKTNSTEYAGSDLSLLTTYTKQLLGTVHTVNPNTSAAWTVSELDALQAGPKARS